MVREIIRNILVFGACLFSLQVCAESLPAPFLRQDWIDDYSALTRHLESSYANLIWFASPESGVKLPDLDKRTRAELQTANSNAEAEGIIAGFVRGFGDGHFSKLANDAESERKYEIPPISRSAPASIACAALGYVHHYGVAFSLPFEATAGFSLLTGGEREAFRTGVAKFSDGRKVGIVRISQFRPQEFPSACEKAWKVLSRAGNSGSCDKKCRSELSRKSEAYFLEEFAKRLRAFGKLHMDAVVVDIAGNPGGNDSGDWTPRFFSKSPIRSPRMGVVHDPKSATYFDEELDDIKGALAKERGEEARSKLEEARKEFERMRALAADSLPCSMDWVWKEQRTWAPLTSECTNLIFGKSFASGPVDYLQSGSLRSPVAEKALYWPSAVSKYLGSWIGPVYVLIDGRTASAAEAAAAVFQDNKVARLVGTKTMGDGCGFMYSGSEFVLPHSRVRYRIPNCLRLRADGTDEVRGIQPDLSIPVYRGESDSERAMRYLEVIGNDLEAGRQPPKL